jgi:hypothetical protein
MLVNTSVITMLSIIPSHVANNITYHMSSSLNRDDNDIIDGRATGAARISFGYMSTYEDVRHWYAV